MLNDFFKLNGDPRDFDSQEAFIEQLSISEHLSNIVYKPEALSPERPQNRIRGKTFENISFSHTRIEGITFQSCTFRDCLFVGTEFVDCEFHDCVFDGVNPYKITFVGTYVDPGVFAGVLRPSDHANIGVHLFQQLYSNASSARQTDFAHTAEFHFRRWQRFQLTYERQTGDISWSAWLVKWLPNVLYHYTTGYGLRSRYFVVWTAVTLALVTGLNHWQWGLLSIRGANGPVADTTLAQSFYFSMITIATVGFGDLVPTSQGGMLLVALEALVGVVWLTLFASTLVKRISR